MSILNVNQIQPVGGGNTITVGSSNIDYSGSITGNISVDGNLTVTGVVSNEDVTNIDSVGIITARSDVSIADKIVHTGDTDTAIRFPGADQVSIETGGTQRFLIGSDGKLVHSTSAAETVDFGTSNSSGSYHKYDLGSSGATVGYIGAGSQIVSGSNVADFGIRSQANLVFSSGGDTERLRITSDGKIGIGDVTPENTLTIKNIGSFEGDANSFYLGSNFTGTGQNFSGSGKHAQRFFFNNASSNGYLKYENTGTTGNAGDAITWQERFRIRSDGNVGIGDNDPSDKLNVKGNSTTSSGIFIHNANGATNSSADLWFGNWSGATSATPQARISALNKNVNTAATDLIFEVYTGNTTEERLRIKSDGKVGIGTDNPQANLHIFEGTGSTRAPAASGNSLVIDSNSEVGMSLLFGTDANTAYGNIYWGNSTDGSADGRITYFGSDYTTAADRQAMTFRTANTERLRITSDGQVQVSNTVSGNDAAVNIYKASGSNSDKAILRVGYDATAAFEIYRIRNNGDIFMGPNQSG